MKKVFTAIAVVVLVSGLSYGQDSLEPSPEMKCYGPFIGTWRYEGPILETIPDVADKSVDIVWQITWRRILDKKVVEGNWTAEVSGKNYAGKYLFGWNAAEKQIAFGGMDSLGSIFLGAVTPDEAAKSLTEVSKGVTADGEETSSTVVIKKTDKDTLTWQALERQGGPLEGKSPVYTFKRVGRTAKAQPGKRAPSARQVEPVRRPQSAEQAPPPPIK